MNKRRLLELAHANPSIWTKEDTKFFIRVRLAAQAARKARRKNRGK